MYLIRRTYSVLLWVILIGLGGYCAYQVYGQPAPCTQPITYRIGTLDPRFGVSTSTFMVDIAAATTIWDDGLNKDLFKYDPNGSLTINLIYDNRQAATQTEHKLTSDIASTTQVADSVKQQYTSLLSQYNAASNAYDTDLAAFNKAAADYAANVQYWNKQGGAPPKEYRALEAERQALQSQQADLENKRTLVNSLASQINALIDKYNLLVDHIHANVVSINNDGLAGTTFEEGVYIRDEQGTRINIYQFDNKTFFVRVIAHELGHALGLAHNTNPDSIMNPVNTSPSLKLSPEDLAALKTECGIK